jgi:predicted Fe-Mo cluster-binding NifX family protein
MTEKVKRLKELGVDVVLCGGISNPLRGMTEAAGIRVIPWLSGRVDDVLAAYFSGSLTDERFAMPGRPGRKGPRYRGGRRDNRW